MNSALKEILKNADYYRNNLSEMKSVLITDKNRRENMKKDDSYKMSAYDFYRYFCFKAKENGITYTKPYEYREKAVIASLINNYSEEDIKWLIDTAWDVSHNIMSKTTMNMFILSKAYLRSLYPLMLKYRSGEIDKFGNEYDPRLHISKNKNLSNGGVWIAGIKIT